MIEAEHLHGADPLARSRALDELMQVAADQPLPAEVLEALLDALGDRSVGFQRGASDVLMRWVPADPRIVPALVSRLEHRESRVRWASAFTVARLGLFARGLVTVLIETLGSPASDLRWAAREALLQVCRRRPETRSEVAESVRTGNPLQRRMCLYTLRDLGGELADVMAAVGHGLEDAEAEVRLAALAASTALDPLPPAVFSRLLRLLDQDADPGVRRAAAMALPVVAARSGQLELAREALEKAATDQDPKLVKAATAALAKC